MNLAALISRMLEEFWGERVFRAVVTGTSGNLVTIQRTGQAAADAQSYARLSSYAAPAVNDEVIVARVGSGWIVLGKVTR